MTRDEASQLPTVVDLPTAGRMLGIGRLRPGTSVSRTLLMALPRAGRQRGYE
jgi:hypothetical protein